MKHSIKNIGDNYEKISIMRGDENLFNANDFLNFAENNKKKYQIEEDFDELVVSSWYSDILIKDYQRSIK